MKKLAVVGILFIIIGISLSNNENAKIPINKLLNPPTPKVTLTNRNKYYRNYDFSYIQNTDDFTPDCRQDILNIYYTAINAGVSEFTFFCGNDYENCKSDIEEIANNRNALSLINSYVHPYNSFKHIETEYSESGKITINIYKSYSESDIAEIEQKLDEIEKFIINPNYTIEENIKNVHDYIINNTKYDTNRRDFDDTTYKSDIAYGPLIQGFAICSGYTDAMQLILERLKVENLKVASENHIWNAVKLDNTWKHLDLTWDDPILDVPLDWLTHDFFLITTEELLNKKTGEHDFNQAIYTEVTTTH